jgi:acyl-coenzyme A synthetase/AMP-(fatty) acid ligase/acyl carrier protein
VLHNALKYTNSFLITAEDRITLLFSSSFGEAMNDLFAALLNGATICPHAGSTAATTELSDWLYQQAITIYHSVPTLFRMIPASSLNPEKFSTFRLIILSGEPTFRADIERFKRYFPKSCRLANAYGSTETKLIRLFIVNHDTVVSEPILPAGYPVEDTAVLLLDELGDPVAAGEVGEVHVRSEWMALGYLGRSDLTQCRFIADSPASAVKRFRTGDLGRLLPDGCLEVVGRKDSQVKIRGYRIELGEVEATLLELAPITAAVVLVKDDEKGQLDLAAYLVCLPGPRPSQGMLRRALAQRLPDYMIPSSFTFLDAMPILPSGKIDRSALPAPDRGRPTLEVSYVPPCTPVEDALAAIWTEVLGIDAVGIHDNFLELGGNSLRATQVMSRVTAAFQVQLPLRSVFEAATVERMALLIVEAQAEALNPDDLAQMLTDLERSSD